MADIPAKNIVIEAEIKRNGLNHLSFVKNGKNRMSRKTPAVTRVEE
jgi:hypothetical protein